MSTFIIAEAGSNHNANFNQATTMIDVANEAGADAVKFQTFLSKELYCKNTPDFAGYRNINKLIEDLEMPRSWLKDIKSYCDDMGIEFMSTPCDEQAVELLYNLGVKRYKIGGFEATDPRFVKFVASTKLPVIITAGIGVGLDMIQNILNWVKEVNPNSFDVTILHGNNAYPSPYEDSNLSQIEKIMDAYPDIRVGYSDHTQGILVPSLAVAKGATVIEKHFTLSKRLPGPDHSFAIEPNELKKMVENIRITEKTLGLKKGVYTKSEENFSKARRSVVTRRNVKKGEIIIEDNITTKRPMLENSIPSTEYYKVLGNRFTRNILEDEILRISDIQE